MTEADNGEDRTGEENLRVGKSADDLDDDNDDVDGCLRDSLLSVSHAVFDVSGTGLVPDLRYSGTYRGDHSGCDKPTVDIKTKAPF